MCSLPEHDAPVCDAYAEYEEDGFTEAAVAARLQALGYEMMQTRKIEGRARAQLAILMPHVPPSAGWYWAVFVHRVPHLDAATLRATQEEDRAGSWCRRPHEIVASIFIADTVEEDARVLLSQPLKPWCGFVPVCAARDTSDGSVHYCRDWQWWGDALLAKVRHLIGRVLLPDVTPEQEPGSSLFVPAVLMSVFSVCHGFHEFRAPGRAACSMMKSRPQPCCKRLSPPPPPIETACSRPSRGLPHSQCANTWGQQRQRRRCSVSFPTCAASAGV